MNNSEKGTFMQKYNVRRHSAAVELDKMLKLLAEQAASELSLIHI